MKLRTIVGQSVSDALRRVQQELGPGALVLETHTKEGRTEVVAAEVERERPTEGLMRLRAEVALLRRELTEGSAGLRAPSPKPTAQPRLAQVERRLLEQDLRPALVARILAMVSKAPASEGDPIDPKKSDYCRNAVAGQVPGVSANGGKKARCFAFAGPPGAGKTTTIAKLAEQTRTKAGQSLGLLTLDGERPGGGALLSSCAERLKIPFRVVRGPEDIQRAFDALGRPRTVLIDTAGLGFRDAVSLNALRERLQIPHQIAVHLVLPANVETDALLGMAMAFRDLSPAAVVFTKIDETERFGNLVNLPSQLDLPVAALCHGRILTSDLAPATRPMIA
ncbi:MAG: hypothetical protein V2A76_14340, partial [Planctomycetota bacterium]